MTSLAGLDKMIKKQCLECKKDIKNLRFHLRKYHTLMLEDYVTKHYYNDVRPTCKCGCKLVTNVHGTVFSDYIVRHNWKSNLQKILEESDEAKKHRSNKIKIGRKNGKKRKANADNYNMLTCDCCNVIFSRRKKECNNSSGLYFCSKTCEKKSLTKIMNMPEVRKNMSIGQSKRNPEKNYAYGKKGHIFCDNKLYYYRSLWERDAISLLSNYVSSNIIKKFETEFFHSIRISYIYENSEHIYIPDMLVYHNDNSKELIEIKPNYKLGDQKTLAKLDASFKWCQENNVRYSIWTEDFLYKRERNCQ